MRATNVCLLVGIVLLGLLPQRSAAAPIMHFDATALALGNGATVTSWAGQTSAGSPVFRTGQTPGGGPAVDFGSGASFGTRTLSPSGSEDFFLAAVLKPTAANAYHNVIEVQPAGGYPLLWIDSGNRYELNKSGGTKVPIGSGAVQGWDIVIADSKNNLLYVNSTTANGTGGSAYSFTSDLTFSFFHRNNGQQFRGLLAEMRIYNEAIDVAAVYEELYQKWTWIPWSTVASSGSHTWNEAPWDTGAPPRIDQTGLLRGGGTITVSDQSTATTPGGLLIGHGGSFGVEMTGGTLTVGNTHGDAGGVFGLTVGESGGHGSFTQSGGTVTSPIVNLARLSSSLSGTYSLNGGTLETGLIRRGSGSGIATLNLDGGTLRATASGGGWIAGGIVVNVQAGGAVIDTQNFDVTMLSPLLDGGGGGGLTMFGSTVSNQGVLRLGAASTYTGPTNVNAGYLVTNVDYALPTTTVVNLNGVGGQVSRMDLRSTTQKIAGLTSDTGATGTIDIYSGGGSTGVLEVDVAASNTYTFCGAMGHSGNPSFQFVKSGQGTQVLAGSLIHTGGTTVAAGTLQIGNNNALNNVGASNFTVAEGATLVFSRNQVPTDFTTQSIGGGGDVVFRGQKDGYFRFVNSNSGTLSYTGKTIVNLDTGGAEWYMGYLFLERDNVLPHATVVDLQSGKIDLRNQTGNGLTIAGLQGNAGTLISATGGGVQKFNVNVAEGSTYTYAGTIQQGIALTKSGLGTQVLTGSSIYTGGTTVAGGTLQFGSNSTSGARPSGLVTLQNDANLALSHNYDYVSGISLPDTTGNGNLVLLGQGTGYYSIRPTTTTQLNYTGTTTLQLDSQLGSTWRGALFVERDSVGLPTTTVLNIVSGKLNLRRNQTIAGLTGTGGFVTTDGTYTPTLVIDFPSTAGLFTYDGVIGRPPETGYNTAGVALEKRGTGTQILTGHHNYTGATTIVGGTLAITGSLPTTSTVTVQNGGTLAGTGTIHGPVSLQSGGILAPGMSVGTLSLNGNLTFAAGSFFDVDIEEVDGGASIADLVDMSGGTNTLTLSDEAFIRVHLLDGFSPDVRTSYTILTGEDSLSGEFGGALVWDGIGDYLPKFDGWKWFDVSYGNSVVLTVVPEPGTWLLLLSAVVCGLAVRRR